MPPEEETACREAERRGQGDQWMRKRMRKGVTKKGAEYGDAQADSEVVSE
jgi:hypothetical protein